MPHWEELHGEGPASTTHSHATGQWAGPVCVKEKKKKLPCKLSGRHRQPILQLQEGRTYHQYRWQMEAGVESKEHWMGIGLWGVRGREPLLSFQNGTGGANGPAIPFPGAEVLPGGGLAPSEAGVSE